MTLRKKYVVHCRREPYDVYIGRPSPFGNPYSHLKESAAKFKVATREQAIKMFEKYLLDRPELVERVKRELVGKTLGCYCAPLPCHGDVLARVANEGVELKTRAKTPKLYGPDQAPIVDAGERHQGPALVAVPFKQFMRPNGTKASVVINRTPRIAALARELSEAGYLFETELLNTGEASFECLKLSGDESDVLASEICANGPDVLEAVDRLVERAHETYTNRTAQKL